MELAKVFFLGSFICRRSEMLYDWLDGTDGSMFGRVAVIGSTNIL